MTAAEEPILSRVDRLDKILRQLEEIRCSNRSPRSSYSSIQSSGTLTDSCASSVDFSPESLEKRCRPIEDVMMETKVKGSLIERLAQLEDRLLKFEDEIEVVKKTAEKKTEERNEKRAHRKGLRHLITTCVRAQGKPKVRDD